jgi:hypothetical protein
MASSTCALKSGFSVPGIASPGQDLPRFPSNSSVRKMTHPTWVESREKQITSIAGRRFVCLKCMAAIVEEPKPTAEKERGSFSRRGALLAAVVATTTVANISPGQILGLRSDHSLEHMNEQFFAEDIGSDSQDVHRVYVDFMQADQLGCTHSAL